MKIYLAARFSRAEEIYGHLQEVERLGHEVTSRWCRPDANHRLPDEVDQSDPRGAIFARQDMEDLESSQLVICFTEPPPPASRGGRHVEFGLALAWGKNIFVVGPRENVFYWDPNVRQFTDWESCLLTIASWTPYVPIQT
jgi:nucleoside 2-deoxyribosyltransferase